MHFTKVSSCSTAQYRLLFVLTLWGRGFCPAAGLPPGAFCDEFAVIRRQK